jgi:hypothetical protein
LRRLLIKFRISDEMFMSSPYLIILVFLKSYKLMFAQIA